MGHMKCYVGSIITINENDDVFGYLVEDHERFYTLEINFQKNTSRRSVLNWEIKP